MTENYKNLLRKFPRPPEEELPNLADYSHPKLLDTTQAPSWDDPNEVEFFFAKVEMNCLFMNILFKFKLNIDDDADTERADRLLSTMVICESIMSQILNVLYMNGKISEETLFDTKAHLFDILLEYPELIEWYSNLAASTVKENRNVCAYDQDDNADAFSGFLAETCEVLSRKLRKILMDELFGDTVLSGGGSPDSNANTIE